MTSSYQCGYLEKFGIYYLKLFRRRSQSFAQLPNDDMLQKAIHRISAYAMIISGIAGIVCVFPMVWVDVEYQNAPWYIHYGWVAAATILFTLIEFYLLFLISLRSVHQVAELVNIHATQKEYQLNGPFSVIPILSRTALEINEPEMEILGINPFKKISRKNLLLLGVMYKLKIIVSNMVLKYALLFLVGRHLFGISIMYEALLVECFWNMVVIHKVIREARLRLFGFVLANQITDTLEKDPIRITFSDALKTTILRAIGNTIVLTKNYHPNMVILLLEMQGLLQIKHPHALDDWQLFLRDLEQLSEAERHVALDVLCVAAAFDGKISDLEKNTLYQAFGTHNLLYQQRIIDLQQELIEGKLHAAFALCALNAEAG